MLTAEERDGLYAYPAQPREAVTRAMTDDDSPFVTRVRGYLCPDPRARQYVGQVGSRLALLLTFADRSFPQSEAAKKTATPETYASADNLESIRRRKNTE